MVNPEDTDAVEEVFAVYAALMEARVTPAVTALMQEALSKLSMSIVVGIRSVRSRGATAVVRVRPRMVDGFDVGAQNLVDSSQEDRKMIEKALETAEQAEKHLMFSWVGKDSEEYLQQPAGKMLQTVNLLQVLGGKRKKGERLQAEVAGRKRPAGECLDWVRGMCNRGDRCRYVHSDGRQRGGGPAGEGPGVVRMGWAGNGGRGGTGTGGYGGSREPFLGGAGVNRAPGVCDAWLRGGCGRGNNCRFLHGDVGRGRSWAAGVGRGGGHTGGGWPGGAGRGEASSSKYGGGGGQGPQYGGPQPYRRDVGPRWMGGAGRGGASGGHYGGGGTFRQAVEGDQVTAANVDQVMVHHMPGSVLARYANELGVDRGWCGYGGRLFAAPCAKKDCSRKGHMTRENLKSSAERLAAMRSVGFTQFGQVGSPGGRAS